MTVHWTESSLDDIRALETYIARRSPQYAQSMVQRIFDRGDGLSSQPRLGPAIASYEAQGLREVFENPYRIIYRIHRERVEIIAVVHGSRQLPRTLSGEA